MGPDTRDERDISHDVREYWNNHPDDAAGRPSRNGIHRGEVRLQDRGLNFGGIPFPHPEDETILRRADPGLPGPTWRSFSSGIGEASTLTRESDAEHSTMHVPGG